MEEVIYKSKPTLVSQYLRAFNRKKKGSGELPEVTLVWEGVRLDRAQVERYNKICRFHAKEGHIPATFPHLLAFPMHMELLLRPDFPYPLLGVVHVSNDIRQLESLSFDRTYKVKVRFDGIRPHEKGKLISIRTDILDGEKCIWSEITEMLKREGKGEGGKKPGHKELPAMPLNKDTWELPFHLGMLYTTVAGDANPIHLLPVTARLFGFKRHIIHGMWTKARCLAALESQIGSRPFSIRTDFKLPVFLPSRITFGFQPVEDGIEFEVRDKQEQKPHLAGKVSFI